MDNSRPWRTVAIERHWFEARPAVVQARGLLRDPHPRLLRRQRRRLGRLPRPDREARLPAVARDRLHLAAADVRRRRCATAATTSPTSSRSTPTTGRSTTSGTFVEAAHQRGMRVIADLVMNHTSTDHPWFQESRSSPDVAEARLVRLVGHRRALPGRADHLHRHRAVELDVGPGRRPVLLAPLLLPPARPQLRQPRGAGGDARRPALLARPRARRLPARRRAVPLRARGHELREPARDARVPEAGARRGRRPLPRPGAARRGQPVAGGRRRVLRRRRRVPHGVPLPGHAAHVHGRCAARRRRRSTRSSSARRRSPTTPVGPVPAQPRRADARDGHRRGARLHVRRVRQGPADEAQPRHPPAARAAARQRARRDRADARDPLLAARVRRSSTTATRSGWATTSTSATATACARRCSGPATATAASRAPTSPSSTCRR